MKNNSNIPSKAEIKKLYESYAEYFAIVMENIIDILHAEVHLNALPTYKSRVKSFNSYYKKILRLKPEETKGCSDSLVLLTDMMGIRMICAFLAKYGKGKVTLPANVTWNDIETMAMKSLVFAYSTHKANKLKVCSGNNYWGSTSTSDAVWESSLWAMSVAYSAFFQWDKLSDAQKNYIYKLLKAECNYELNRSIPTGYAGDTKAEENGWEADVLAVTLGLFPNDELAPKWFARLREFAINSYSQKDDAMDATIIDPDYDKKTVKDLYKGQNLYDDYTLQNHNYFHTSYQNVVIQELAESMLVSPKLFSKTLGLTHHWQEVWDEVLVQLALADGELAMPNGNDWSMFLYDQLPAYAAMATMLKSSDALLLERRCLDQLLKRQRTTSDGSYMLHPDIGPRRMGVTAHRVMMTYLMHRHFGTRRVKASTWDDFCQRMARTKTFPSQQIVRSMSADRFACFSWSEGLKNATGIIVPNEVEDTKIIVPYKNKGTGNFLGCYNNAQTRLSGKPQFTTTDSTFQVRGRLMAAGGKVAQDFTFTADAHNGVIVEYQLMGNDTILQERGGTVAVSVDPFTKTERTLYYENGEFISDGSQLRKFRSNWVNIDNRIGIIVLAEDNEMAFGDRQLINSIQTARLYPTYCNTPQVASSIKRKYLYFTNQTAQQTRQMFQGLRSADAP